jgi:hypothetical protein
MASRQLQYPRGGRVIFRRQAYLARLAAPLLLRIIGMRYAA